MSAAVSALRETDTEHQGRIDLAAVFRLAARFDWHEGIANHFSLAVSDDGKRFLMNPRWRHFSRIKASDLMLLDADDDTAMAAPDAPDPSAWCIHARLHAALPQARCLLHTHMPYATALATLADPEIPPLDQNCMRFYGRIAYDLGYTGIALAEAEGDRLARTMGNKSVLMMGNHGVLVAGRSVAEAFDELYYLEKACRTVILAYATGRPLNPAPPALAAKVAQEWSDYPFGFADAHFAEMKAILDEESPDYAQ